MQTSGMLVLCVTLTFVLLGSSEGQNATTVTASDTPSNTTRPTETTPLHNSSSTHTDPNNHTSSTVRPLASTNTTAAPSSSQQPSSNTTQGSGSIATTHPHSTNRRPSIRPTSSATTPRSGCDALLWCYSHLLVPAISLFIYRAQG